jgi:hypothetical protein
MPRYTFICHTDKPKALQKRGYAKGNVSSIHDFTTINRRIKKLNIQINNNKVSGDEYLIIAIDSTGIKVTHRGKWMKETNGIQKRKDI